MRSPSGLRGCSSWALGCVGRRRLRDSLPVALCLVALFSPGWGFSVFVLPLVVVAVPRGPRGLVGVLLLAFSLVPWRPGEGCGVGLARLRVLRSCYFVFGVLDFGIFPISTWLRILAVFCGIFRVAGCPPGGEICRM